MTFQLKPGDYVMASDIENEEMHNAIREAFRMAGCRVSDDLGTYGGREFGPLGWDEDNDFYWIEDREMTRRVYPHQILAKPMLIEALKPGMRARLFYGEPGNRTIFDGKMLASVVRHSENGFIEWEETAEHCNHACLTTTDYEIIPDDPKPWKPTPEDPGYHINHISGLPVASKFFATDSSDEALHFRTKQAADQMANIMRVYTAIMNMPGAFEGNNSYAWMYGALGIVGCTDAPPETIFDVPFDTYENAKAAATEANRIIEEMG